MVKIVSIPLASNPPQANIKMLAKDDITKNEDVILLNFFVKFMNPIEHKHPVPSSQKREVTRK